MSYRRLLDPELHALVDAFPAFNLDADNLTMLRSLVSKDAAPREIDDALGVKCSERIIPGPADAPRLRVCLYEPASAAVVPRPAVLHVHGGGYVMGAPEICHEINLRRARGLDCVVVSVDYRLAPETPYPGPLEDCQAALEWLHGEADALGVDPARLAVAGESAGAGLAAALVLLAHDDGKIPLCLQLLDSPMIDDRTARSVDPGPSLGEFMWTRESNRFGWASYLGQAAGTSEVGDYGAAARRTDLAGLPPTFISVGALDLFAPEAINYATRLMIAAVPTELHVYPGACHGFGLMPRATVSQNSLRDADSALQRAFSTVKTTASLPSSAAVLPR